MSPVDGISPARFYRLADRTTAVAGGSLNPQKLMARMRAIQERIGDRVRALNPKQLTKVNYQGMFGPKYQVEEIIACTLTSTVYKARDMESGSLVVIKRGRCENTDLLVEREGQLLERLSHPSLVRCCSDWGEGYFVEEYLAGVNLDNFERPNSLLNHKEALVILYSVVEVLDYLHQNQIIARDLKNDNVMISPAGKVTLIDLGLVKDLTKNNDIGYPTTFFGRPEFAAPEIIMRGSGFVTEESDYYSLGIILYRILTQTIPWQREIYLGIQSAKVSFPEYGLILTDKWLNPIPPPVRPILLGLLERDPKQRLSHPDQLQSMILEALS
ncbi:MAG: serine/threonine-protein kinase [Candidatus Margulisiibacteriota bacterium]